MKKSSLTTAVVAGLAGAAGLVNVSNAVNVNPDGLGQVLIYPYYTVNGGNSTLISVVNTTNDVKAVKVRFLENLNSQEVLDFNLYLSPFDVWTGGAYDIGTEGGVMITRDKSCTVPYFYQQFADAGMDATNLTNADSGGNYQGFFKNFQYAALVNGVPGHNADGGPSDLARTREGHLEMIEMGRVVDDGDILTDAPLPTEGSTSAVDDAPNPAPYTGSRLANAATHVNGVPRDCQALLDAFRVVDGVQGQWQVDVNSDVDTPNGGLFGGAEIVNAQEGTNMSYNADALEGFFQTAGLDLHSFTGDILPNLTQADPASTVVFDNGTLITLEFGLDENLNGHTGLDAVSAAFMHNQIYNEYVTTPGAGAASEWVITFPTKLMHIDDTILEVERRPFTQAFNWAAGGACEAIELSFWDREEQVSGRGTSSGDNCPSPLPPGQASCDETPNVVVPDLCFETNVLAFNQGGIIEYIEESSVLGSRWAINVPLVDLYAASGNPAADANYFHEGWVRIDFTRDSDKLPTNHFTISDAELSGAYNVVQGLPVTGFWAAQYVNGELSEGVLANYSGLHRHRADRTGYATDDPTPGLDSPGTLPEENGFAWS